MARMLYYKYGEVEKTMQTSEGGQVNIRQLATILKLQVDSIELDDVAYNIDPDTGWTVSAVPGGVEPSHRVSVSGHPVTELLPTVQYDLKRLTVQVSNQGQQLATYQQTVQQQGAELMALRHDVALQKRSSRSAAAVGKDVMSKPSWQQDSTAEILNMLAPVCAEPAAAAKRLLDVIPHSWTELAQKERDDRALMATPKRKRAATEPETDEPEAPADQPRSKKGGEATVQLGMMAVLRALQALYPDMGWHLYDTSASGLAGRQGPIDVSFMSAALKAWPQLLFYGELKSTLEYATPYSEVIGQLMDRSVDLFAHQPPQRTQVFAFAAGRDSLQVLCIRRHADPIHTRLEPFSFSPTSPGLLLLLRLTLADKGVHGFVETQPPPIQLPDAQLSQFALVDWRAPDEAVLVAAGTTSQGLATAQASSSTVRGSQVWRATMARPGGRGTGESPEQQVAVKTGPARFIAYEAVMLQRLAHVPGLVRLVHSQTLPPAPAWLITSPFGRCLSLDDDADLILAAVGCVADTIGRLARLQPPVLHRDISLGNIVVLQNELESFLEEDYQARLDRKEPPPRLGAYLVDLATACEAPGGELVSTSLTELTGTPLFMAISLLEHGPHTVSTELESLYLVLVFVACGGWVHWANTLPGRDASALKFLSFMGDFFDGYVRRRCRVGLLPAVERLRNLFFVPQYNTGVKVEHFLAALHG